MGFEILLSKLPGDVDVADFTDRNLYDPLISKQEVQGMLKRFILFKAIINIKP